MTTQTLVDHRGGTNHATSVSLAVLNTLLSDMSGPEQTELWGLEALAGSPLWGNVRHQARAVLFLL